MENKKMNNTLQDIHERVSQKQKDYQGYNFNQDQNDILKTFFDLAQEYESLDDCYLICVAVLHHFLGVEVALYLVNEKTGLLEFTCDSSCGLSAEPVPLPDYITCTENICRVGSSYLLPIMGGKPLAASSGIPGHGPQNVMLGQIEIKECPDLSTADQFFLSKFASRVGFNLHNRMIALQNVSHIKFINNLVMDIEHNVIIPNMYFKHLFNRVRKRIRDVEEIEDAMKDMKESLHFQGTACEEMLRKVAELRKDLIDYHREMEKHHSNCSLFLESLFRRDHFEKGHLVLHSKKCLVENDVILPQLDQYASRLAAQGITIERPSDMSGQEIPLRVDIGLMSQVYANYFSNAVKYTQEVIGYDGKPRKAVAYGLEVKPDYFGSGHPGIKFNVFSTGQHLDREDSAALFSEGYRGKNSDGTCGTGHGLTFVKQVVEIHGGESGYEPTNEGNNFYFILPLDQES